MPGSTFVNSVSGEDVTRAGKEVPPPVRMIEQRSNTLLGGRNRSDYNGVVVFVDEVGVSIEVEVEVEGGGGTVLVPDEVAGS